MKLHPHRTSHTTPHPLPYLTPPQPGPPHPTPSPHTTPHPLLHPSPHLHPSPNLHLHCHLDLHPFTSLSTHPHSPHLTPTPSTDNYWPIGGPVVRPLALVQRVSGFKIFLVTHSYCFFKPSFTNGSVASSWVLSPSTVVQFLLESLNLIV